MIDSATFSVAETAHVLGVSEMTVYRLIEAGDLPAVVLRRRKRVPRRAVELLLDRALVDFNPDRLLPQLAGAAGPPTAAGTDTPAPIDSTPPVEAERVGGSTGPARLALFRS